MSPSDALRLSTFVLVLFDAALVTAFGMYLRDMCVPAGLAPPRPRAVAVKVGTLVLLLLMAAAVAATVAGMHHLIGVSWINYAARVVVLACMVGVALAMSSWYAFVLESRYRGRWPRLDHAIERVLHWR